MQYKIGYSFLLTIKDKRGIWAITEIDKKRNNYIFTGISNKVKGIINRVDIDVFDKIDDLDFMPVFKPAGKIVETEDRIYIQQDKEQDLGITL